MFRYLKLHFLMLCTITLLCVNPMHAGTMSIKGVVDSGSDSGSEEDDKSLSRIRTVFPVHKISLHKKKSFPSLLTEEPSLAKSLPPELWMGITTCVRRHPLSFLILAHVNKDFHRVMWTAYYSIKNIKSNFVLEAEALFDDTHNRHYPKIANLRLKGRKFTLEHYKALRFFENLKSLSFSGCNLCDPEKFSLLFQSLPKLRNLDLSRCGLKDSTVKSIAPYLSSLLALNLNNNPLSDRAAFSLSKSLYLLEYLSIWEFQEAFLMGIDGFNELGAFDGLKGYRALLNSLHSLKTLGLNIRTNKGALAFSAAIGSRSGLESLYLYRADQVEFLEAEEKNSLYNSIIKLTNLKNLTIKNFDEIYDQDASLIAGSLVHLHTLDLQTVNSFGQWSGNNLHFSGKITCKGINLITQKLKNLRSLALPCNRVGNDSVKLIARNLPDLENLNLMYTSDYAGGNYSFISDVSRIARYLTNLTSLGLPGFEMGDDALKTISCRLTRLKALCFVTYRTISSNVRAHFQEPQKLSSVGLKAIHSLPRLQRLRLDRNQISPFTFEQLKDFLQDYENIHGHQLQLSGAILSKSTGLDALLHEELLLKGYICNDF